MDLLLIGFFIVHAYLLIISIWYGSLFLLYHVCHPDSGVIPEYVQALFDKDDGESVAVAAGSTFLLVSLGFFFEVGLLIRHPFGFVPVLSIALLAVGGLLTIAAAAFFFLDWRQTARINAAPLPPE